MKIAFIAPFSLPLFIPSPNSNNNFGGAEVQQMLLANYLVEKGHDVKLLVKASPNSCNIRANGIEIIPFSMRFAGGSNFWISFDVVSLLHALNKADADLYVIKGPRVLLSVIGIFCRIKRRKLVFWFTIDRDVNLADIEGIGGKTAWQAYRLGLKFPHHVIAQSKFQMERSWGIGLKSASFLPSLVRMDSIVRLELKSNPPIVLWVGSTDKVKHPEIFLKMARTLPEIQFKMIVSERSQARANELRSLCELIPNLKYLGSVAYQDMDEHYSKASLFVSTSELEGVPNTFLQSWANGTPVVSLSIDPDGIIEKKRLGICANGNLELLKEEIRRLITNRDLRIEMGDKSRVHITETHRVETVGPKYVEMFQKILS